MGTAGDTILLVENVKVYFAIFAVPRIDQWFHEGAKNCYGGS